MPDAGYFAEPVQGPMARTVTDCALFLDAMAGFEPRFPISFPAPDTPYQTAVERANGKLRIAFTPDLNGFAPLDREVDECIRAALNLLEKNGAVVDELSPELAELDHTYHTLRGLLWATIFKHAPAAITDSCKQTLKENTAFGRALTVDDVVDANLNRTTMFNNMLKLFQTHEVLALPTVGCMPHLQSEEWVHEIGGQTLTGYMDWLRYAFLATVAGLPAISVPVGLGPNGLPVGMQLIGKPRGEAALLAAARAVEMAVGGPLGPIDPNVTHLKGA